MAQRDGRATNRATGGAGRAEPVLDLAYRLLGALVGARRALLLALIGGGFAVGLLLVHNAAGTPNFDRWLPALLFPALLLLAGRWLLGLPPGVVFRPAPVPEGIEPERTARCLASGLFATERGARWRLLARSSLALGRHGTLHLVSPPPLGSGRAVDLAFAKREPIDDPVGPSGSAAADLAKHPEALDPGRWRGSYGSADAYTAAVGELAIPLAVLAEATVGWQYAGLRRWPAVRLAWREAPDLIASAYLAFPSAAQRAWLLAQLGR